MIEVGPGKPVWAMGLMSGTSMDGVDAAMLLTDGEAIFEFGPSAELPYAEMDNPFTTLVAETPVAYRNLDPDNAENEGFLEELGAAESEVERAHARAVIAGLAAAEATSEGITPRVIGFHGQTIAHAPEQGWTWQLGDGDRLSRLINRPVVWDFRTDDMKAGGEGAPLAPFYHFALAKSIAASEPVVFLNIGGVANVTWVDPRAEVAEQDDALVAFDTGPGNAMINDWMQRKTGKPLDRNGALAASGEVDWMHLHTNSGKAYLDRKPPKSLDRNDFHAILKAVEDLSPADGAATLTAFTVECIAESVVHMPSPPTRWLVCGGGRHNATMMRMLSERLEAPVDPVEAVGLDGDMLEAQAFAYLAVRVLRGLPTSAPSTTGCREPVSGGRISYP